MDSSRREFLRTLTAVGASAFIPRFSANAQDHEHSAVTASAVMGLEPFVDALRIPPVLKPIKVKTGDAYSITMQVGTVKCHRDLPPTEIWGYNGIFPGPTIVANKTERYVSGKRTICR